MGRTIYLKQRCESPVAFDFSISILGVGFSFWNTFDLTHYELVTETGELIYTSMAEDTSRKWAEENGFIVEPFSYVEYE